MVSNACICHVVRANRSPDALGRLSDAFASGCEGHVCPLRRSIVERARIARDLHDTLLQPIQGSKQVADSALKQSTHPLRMRGALEQLSVWLGRATEEGRAALNSLGTSTTETNDLAESFRRAIEECRIENSMEGSFSVVGDTREMHPIVRDEVYRIGTKLSGMAVHIRRQANYRSPSRTLKNSEYASPTMAWASIPWSLIAARTATSACRECVSGPPASPAS